MRPDQFVYCEGECGLVVTVCTCPAPADNEDGQGAESLMAAHLRPRSVAVDSPAKSVAHYIEERAEVYLRLADDGSGWEIDGATMDGAGLEGYEHGPVNAECQCGDDTACDEALAASRTVPWPDGYELTEMLVADLVRRASVVTQLEADLAVATTVCTLYVSDAQDGTLGPDEQDAAQSAIAYAVERGIGDDAVRVANMVRHFRNRNRAAAAEAGPAPVASGERVALGTPEV